MAALTIAGTDSSGGAGITADLKTFLAHDVWGFVAVTAVTAQNADGVHAIEAVSPALVAAQIRAVRPAVAKTGMLPSRECVEAVLGALPTGVPLVVDPVLQATTGEALSVVTPQLIARATVITPNREEAAALTGAADPVEAAGLLVRMGAQVVMVTGSESARDIVATAADVLTLDGVPIDAPNTHGTGCILSAAITAELAKGMDPVDACIAAKHFVAQALAAGYPFFDSLPA
ncbi:MAG TPA: hydroxymethylpyrimidine/phosphomethylpyrimidine kinase [Acidimicrobiales bacterium]|nr:hydroxymethylpyrimidine/phosphomethylpyrimidine kinase [Acidimicrobiales bacterium]